MEKETPCIKSESAKAEAGYTCSIYCVILECMFSLLNKYIFYVKNKSD